MKFLFVSLLSLVTAGLHAQFYYNDINGTSAINVKARAFFAAKVRSVTATGFDAQGSKTTDFNETQDVDATKNQVTVTRRTGQEVSRQWYRFDENGRVSTLTDSSNGFKSETAYTYDQAGKLMTVSIRSLDTTDGFNSADVHQYIYNTGGKPEKMWRIVDGRDSTEYRFSIDDNGNVSGEQLFRRNVGLDQVYYYYDDQHRLTDVVRYDKRTKKLLPDFMFEYDGSNQVIQQITTLSAATRNYLIWRYAYNSQGIRTKEALYNKQKELTGKIEYTIVYSQ